MKIRLSLGGKEKLSPRPKGCVICGATDQEGPLYEIKASCDEQKGTVSWPGMTDWPCGAEYMVAVCTIHCDLAPKVGWVGDPVEVRDENFPHACIRGHGTGAETPSKVGGET